MNSFPSLKEQTLVILCGGKSSRMKEDKSLLPFASYKTLTQYQFERFKPHFKTVYLSAKSNKFDFLDDSQIIFDEGDIASPMVALQTILKNSHQNRLFILTVDTPFVSLQTISRLFDASTEYDITVAKTERLHSLCGVFSTNILPIVQKCLEEDNHKIGYLLKQVKTCEVPCDNEDEFLNLNHPSDYQDALAKL